MYSLVILNSGISVEEWNTYKHEIVRLTFVGQLLDVHLVEDKML